MRSKPLKRKKCTHNAIRCRAWCSIQVENASDVRKPIKRINIIQNHINNTSRCDNYNLATSTLIDATSLYFSLFFFAVEKSL